MKALGRALLDLVAVIDLTGDSITDPDPAVQALHSFLAPLNDGDAGDRAYLKEAMIQEIGSMEHA